MDANRALGKLLLSSRVRELVDAILSWIDSLPPNTAKVSKQAIPEDDEYGLELIIMIEPTKMNACPVEIGIVNPANYLGVYLFLDNWAEIARRAELEPPEVNKAKQVGFYVEPTALSVARVLEICKAIAAGSVKLEIGIVARKLVCTKGWVILQHDCFIMHGIGGFLPLLKIAAYLGLAETRELGYEPWV